MEKININQQSPEKIKTYQEKCDRACDDSSKIFEQILKIKSIERIREKPVFKAKGREFPIKDCYDFQRALLQAKKELAEETADKSADYLHEEIARKFADMYKAEEIFWSAYAEFKLYDLKKMSAVLENDHPFLAEYYQQAQQNYEEFKKGLH